MGTGRHRTYGVTARRFHWWTAGLLAVQIPLGIGMVVRGSWLDIWDGLTNASYSTHKLLGVVIFLVAAARLLHRLAHGVPEPEPTTEPWRRRVGALTHRTLYALLLAVPAIGWFGVQLYPALDLFGLVALPAVVAPDRAASMWVLRLHAAAAFALLALVALHIAAALHHRFVRKDRVFQRMHRGSLPSLDQRTRTVQD